MMRIRRFCHFGLSRVKGSSTLLLEGQNLVKGLNEAETAVSLLKIGNWNGAASAVSRVREIANSSQMPAIQLYSNWWFSQILSNMGQYSKERKVREENWKLVQQKGAADLNDLETLAHDFIVHDLRGGNFVGAKQTVNEVMKNGVKSPVFKVFGALANENRDGVEKQLREVIASINNGNEAIEKESKAGAQLLLAKAISSSCPEEALTVYEQVGNSEDLPELLRITALHGFGSVKAGKRVDAHTALTTAIRLAETRFGQESAELCLCLSELAWLYMTLDPTTAEGAQRTAMAKAQQLPLTAWNLYVQTEVSDTFVKILSNLEWHGRKRTDEAETEAERMKTIVNQHPTMQQALTTLKNRSLDRCFWRSLDSLNPF